MSCLHHFFKLPQLIAGNSHIPLVSIEELDDSHPWLNARQWIPAFFRNTEDEDVYPILWQLLKEIPPLTSAETILLFKTLTQIPLAELDIPLLTEIMAFWSRTNHKFLEDLEEAWHVSVAETHPFFFTFLGNLGTPQQVLHYMRMETKNFYSHYDYQLEQKDLVKGLLNLAGRLDAAQRQEFFCYLLALPARTPTEHKEKAQLVWQWLDNTPPPNYLALTDEEQNYLFEMGQRGNEPLQHVCAFYQNTIGDIPYPEFYSEQPFYYAAAADYFIQGGSLNALNWSPKELADFTTKIEKLWAERPAALAALQKQLFLPENENYLSRFQEETIAVEKDYRSEVFAFEKFWLPAPNLPIMQACLVEKMNRRKTEAATYFAMNSCLKPPQTPAEWLTFEREYKQIFEPFFAEHLLQDFFFKQPSFQNFFKNYWQKKRALMLPTRLPQQDSLFLLAAKTKDEAFLQWSQKSKNNANFVGQYLLLEQRTFAPAVAATLAKLEDDPDLARSFFNDNFYATLNLTKGETFLPTQVLNDRLADLLVNLPPTDLAAVSTSFIEQAPSFFSNEHYRQLAKKEIPLVEFQLVRSDFVRLLLRKKQALLAHQAAHNQ